MSSIHDNAAFSAAQRQFDNRPAPEPPEVEPMTLIPAREENHFFVQFADGTEIEFESRQLRFRIEDRQQRKFTEEVEP